MQACNFSNSTPNTQMSFYGRPHLRKELPRVKNAIENTMPSIAKPSYIRLNGGVLSKFLTEIDYQLRVVRSLIDSSFAKGTQNYFHDLFYGVKAHRVANCAELAEITKVALKANGVKNCDVFQVYAKKRNSNQPPRMIDHIITAVNVPKSKNNKKTLEPFVPSDKTRVVDLWADGFVGTIKGARSKYKKLGVQEDDIIMLAPVTTMEPEKATLEKLKRNYPTIDLHNKK